MYMALGPIPTLQTNKQKSVSAIYIQVRGPSLPTWDRAIFWNHFVEVMG
jgi:hypothetical protein